MENPEAVAREIRRKAYDEDCDCHTDADLFQSRLICEECLTKIIVNALTTFAAERQKAGTLADQDRWHKAGYADGVKVTWEEAVKIVHRQHWIVRKILEEHRINAHKHTGWPCSFCLRTDRKLLQAISKEFRRRAQEKK